MQGNFLTESVDQVIELIQKLDLESIKLKIMDPELGAGWTTERVGSAECEYREFLVMLLKYPEQAERIVISKDADEFWHQHIMHTRKCSGGTCTIVLISVFVRRRIAKSKRH